MSACRLCDPDRREGCDFLTASAPVVIRETYAMTDMSITDGPVTLDV